MPDETYDRLARRLGELESELGISSDLTTQVPETTTKGFQTVLHAVPMLSVDNTYNPQELEKWLNDVWNDESHSFVIQPKVDGIALTLIYEHGEYVRAITRGDGNKGDDVTKNAFMLPIPLKLTTKAPRLEIRGEVYMPFEEFERVNEKLPADVPKYRNPRNLAAGTMKSHSPEDTLNRGLKFLAHGFGLCSDPDAPAQVSARLDYLGKNTPYVNAYDWIIKSTVIPKISITPADVLKLVDVLNEERKQLPYPTDGLVIKCNSFDAHAKLGAGSKYVKWAVAAKFETETVRTKLVKIDWQVGMSGRVTPRATLEPVDINGTTVSAAGVHNGDIVEELELYDGCEVDIEKAGEIIPQIVRCVNPDSSKPKGTCQRPTVCPGCQIKLQTVGPNLFCTNEKCTDIIEGHIHHFVGRDQMDIAGFGDVTIQVITQAGYLRGIADLYRLKDYEKDLIGRCRLGAKTVSKLLESIEASKQQPFHRVLAGLGIPMIGNKVSRQLAEYYPNLNALLAGKPETLPDIFGETTRNAIINAFFVNKSKAKDVLFQLQAYGVALVEEKPKTQAVSATTPVTGKKICITGTLSAPRSKVMAELIKRGAIEQGNLSSSTDILLAGDEAGSKLDKALKLGIPVYYEKWYQQLLQDYPA